MLWMTFNKVKPPTFFLWFLALTFSPIRTFFKLLLILVKATCHNLPFHLFFVASQLGRQKRSNRFLCRFTTEVQVGNLGLSQQEQIDLHSDSPAELGQMDRQLAGSLVSTGHQEPLLHELISYRWNLDPPSHLPPGSAGIRVITLGIFR